MAITTGSGKLLFGASHSVYEREEQRKNVEQRLIDIPEAAEEVRIRLSYNDWASVEFKLNGEYHRCILEQTAGNEFWPKYCAVHHNREQGGPWPRLVVGE